MKNKIYIKQWLKLKPYENQTLTDNYYLKLSNEIKNILKTKHFLVLQTYFEESEVDLLSCFLASYFEDIISGTNIWFTFRNCHKRLYKKLLPFYNTDDYYEEEINLQDISFLVWYFMNTVQEGKFISPYNDFFNAIAADIIEIFDDEYEYAPENKHLKSFYKLNENETDYYKVRIFIDKILFNTYLFFPDSGLQLLNKEIEIIEENKDDKNLMPALQDTRDNFLHKCFTRLLGLKGKEWAAEILGSDHPAYSDLLTMSQRIVGLFLYKGQNNEDIFLEHIASGKKFMMTKKSFDHHSALEKPDTILFIGLIQWRKEWWFSGVYFQIDFNADIVLEEKNSIQSRMAVGFLDHAQQDTGSFLKQQLNAFLDFNNGSLIAFLPSDKIDGFIQDYIRFYQDSLNLSEKEKEQAIRRARKEGFFGGTDEHKDNYAEIAETGLVFFNSKSGCEIAFGVNSAFPTKNNPYFRSEESEDNLMHLLMSEEMSSELAKFCIDHCKTDLPFFQKGIGKKYLQDFDFLLRFWKKEKYHSRPAITFTGQNPD